MKLSLRNLRQTGRTWMGKTVALTLCVALTLPPTFSVAAELAGQTKRYVPGVGNAVIGRV